MGSAFVEHLKDVFATLGTIAVRPMFGGHGVYFQDVMFALVVDDTLYLKTDSGNVQHFETQGLGPFEYTGKDGRTVRMSYHRAPESVLEDPASAVVWARRSIDAAQRQHDKKKPTSTRAFTESSSLTSRRRY